MTKFKVLFASTLIALTAFAAPALAADPHEAEIEQLVLDLYEASNNADLAFFENVISQSPEATFLGSDPAEVFVGHDQIVQWWSDLFAALESLGYPNGSLPTLAEGDPIQIQRRGSVAWVTDDLRWVFHKGEVLARLTLVLQREHGEWKIVQGHFSVGVLNGDIL
jgi:ketosteroid isomerase-like protein